METKNKNKLPVRETVYIRRPKIQKWPEETTYKFVKEYIANECLWNLTKQSYQEKRLRKAAYGNIEKAMDLQGFGYHEVLQKTKNIRSTYAQELKKIKNSRLSCCIYRPTLKWFNILHTALSQNVEQEERDSIMISDSENAQTNFVMNTSVAVNRMSPIPFEVQSSAQQQQHQQDEQPPKSPPLLESTEKFFNPNLKNVNDVLDHVKDIVQSISNSSEQNEFDVFGQFVGSQLRKLPPVEALTTQQHTQSYLYQMRVQDLNRTTINDNSSVYYIGPS